MTPAPVCRRRGREASVWVELFILSKVSLLLDRAEAHLKRAHLAWTSVADIARDIYHDDLTYGPQTWLRGSWQKRLQEIEIELNDVQAMRCDPPIPGVTPSLISGWPNFALSAAMMKSAIIATSQPPPRA